MAVSRPVLLLTEILPPRNGGSGRWLWELYRRFPHGSAVVVAADHPGAAEFDREHRLPVVRVPWELRDTGGFSPNGASDYARLARRILRICQERDVRTIHCARCLPEGWVAWLLRRWAGIPYSCYAHGEEVKLTGVLGGGVMSSRQHRWMGKLALHGAERFVANSRNTAAILRREWRLPGRKITVLHPGVDARIFRPAAPSADIRLRLGWDGRTVILTVGRLQQRKGQDHMIRALPKIREWVPDVLYVIAGSGADEDRLRKLAGELGVDDQVRFAGPPTDAELIDHYQQCDLFALPNRQIGTDLEGFGMVLLEAQACGKAVFAGDSGGTREAIIDGVTGRLADCSTPEGVADAVIDLLGDRDQLTRMGEAGRQWVAEHFEWESLSRRAASSVLRLTGSPGDGGDRALAQALASGSRRNK